MQNKKKIWAMVQLFFVLLLIGLWFLYSNIVFNESEKEFDKFCNTNYNDSIISCRRVKGWVILKLKSGISLEFGLYSTEENVSAQFAKEVETGDIFIKYNSSSEVTIRKKSGEEKKWYLHCSE